MTNKNNASLLAALGISMGFSADDMHNIIVDTQSSIIDTETRSPLEDVADVTKDMDTKTLFVGAMLYGYVLDAYDGIDVFDIINQEDDE